ncbi:MAG TPA: RDD family protein [Pilimelia sp.]|nr:RDD family protein [Pilimelia sp.]
MTAPGPWEYAGPVSRAVAYLLDTLVVAVVFTGAAAVAGMVTSVMGARLHDLTRAATSTLLLALPALLAAYCTLFWALTGRTPGMAVLGVRVVGTRPRRLSWAAALLRALLLAYFPVGAVWALVDRRHQAVHDKVARTVVIRTPPARRTRRATMAASPPPADIAVAYDKAMRDLIALRRERTALARRLEAYDGKVVRDPSIVVSGRDEIGIVQAERRRSGKRNG